jgi:hypothetical protein
MRETNRIDQPAAGRETRVWFVVVPHAEASQVVKAYSIVIACRLFY